MCNKECSGCPFAFSEESEKIQDYGCLPTHIEIVRMRVDFGKTWACHADPKKPCAGAIAHLKEKGLPYQMIDKTLATEQSDFLVGFGALLRAEEKLKQAEENNARLLEDARHWRGIAEESFLEIRKMKRGK